MTIRKDIMLVESALMESVDLSFLETPAGELLKYSFNDSANPVELQHAIIGTATDLRNAIRAGDSRVARDHGIANGGELHAFMNFVQGVANNPEQYFNAYTGGIQEADGIDELESEMPYLDGAEKEEAEDDLISAIGDERYGM